MAMAEPSTSLFSAADKYPEDITECSNCHKTSDDPRQLPCMHTFCHKCIQEFIAIGSPEIPDQNLECPLCGEQFLVPETGFPKDALIISLIETKKLTELLSREEVFCDVCSDGEVSVEGFHQGMKALVHCVDCRRSMCDQCHRFHQKFSFPGGHKVIGLDKEIRPGELLIPETKCEKHVDKSLEFYCFDCNVAVCMTCFISKHNLHKCSDLKEVSDNLKIEIKAASDRLNGKVGECHKILNKIVSDQRLFLENVEKIENEIIARVDELKKMIENHKSKLLGELDEAKSKHVKHLSRVRQDVEAKVMTFESFRRYMDEFGRNGTACDVTKSASAVRQRAKELMEFDVEEQFGLNCVDINFTTSRSLACLQRLFGQLEIRGTDNAVKPWKVISNAGNGCGEGDVMSITTLNDELIVASYGAMELNVCDSRTLSYRRQLSLPANATGSNNGLAACHVNKCIYVSDCDSRSIHKLSVCGRTAADALSWLVDGNCFLWNLGEHCEQRAGCLLLWQ